jgi:aryl-alcohol dehydrogenase-like predicted oxidoreductase
MILRLANIAFNKNSQNQTSEEFIGEWMEARNNRDQIVLATKAS